MRDAIIISGWYWEACNVPERLALALAYSGRRVLYCDNPVSFLRHHARDLIEVEKEVFALGLKFLGHRFSAMTAVSKMQTRYLASQILITARKLALKRPLFIYPHGEHCLTLCQEFKRRGYSLVHICMDYHLQEQMAHVQASDLTLVIPQIAFWELRSIFGVKVQALPQMAWR